MIPVPFHSDMLKKLMLRSSFWIVRVTWKHLFPVHHYETLSSSNKRHRIQTIFQTLTARSACCTWPVTLETQNKWLTDCLHSHIFLWIFPPGRRNPTQGNFTFQSMSLFFSLSVEFKMLSIISNCPFPLIVISNYCSPQKRQK